MNNGQQQLNNNNCSDANHSTSAPKVSKTCATPFDKDYDNIRDDENYYQEQFDADDDDDCKLLCHNLLLRFPKPPYDVQKKIVERIIYSLNQKKNILIESPTGTGKTLSLLCSTLAWLRSAKVQNNWPKPPKIIYATRTHSQISQLIGEIKKTAYSDMKICFLASREQLCINDRVMNREKKGSINSKCRNLVSSGKCIYKSNVGKENSGMDETKLFDIEELKIIGKQKSTCPYYYTREIALQADLIFMPYNYILEKAIRQRLQIDFDCSIIVFDEAHNVEKTCEDGFSLKICGSDIALAMHEITDFANHLRINFDYFKNRPSISDSSDESSFKNSKSKNTAANSGGNSVKSVDWTDVAAFKRVLCILEYHIKEMGIGCKNEFKTLKAQVLYDHVIGANFTQDTAKNFFILDECIKYHNSDLNSTLLKGFGSERILNLFEFFHQGEFGSLDDYIVCAKNLSDDSLGTKDVEINLWCLNPSIAMKSLADRNILSMIFASGTLSPMENFVNSLQLKNPVLVQNSHVIDEKQIKCCIVKQGPKLQTLSSTFNNRSNPMYLESLLSAISILSKLIPNGLLIFFPSFTFLEMALENWKNSKMYLSILKDKYVEPKSKEQFKSTIEKYFESCIDNPHGALMMAVCRAKLSEGIDFSDAKCRAVIVIGIPYPNQKDPKVSAKLQYLNDNKNSGLDSNSWYLEQACKTVNQAIGRVIRHKNDYGMIFLMDERFAQPKVRKSLPKWILSSTSEINDSFATCIKLTKNFYGHFSHLKNKNEDNERARVFNTPENTNRVAEITETSRANCISKSNLGNSDGESLHSRHNHFTETIQEFKKVAKSLLHSDEYQKFSAEIKKYYKHRSFETFKVETRAMLSNKKNHPILELLHKFIFAIHIDEFNDWRSKLRNKVIPE